MDPSESRRHPRRGRQMLNSCQKLQWENGIILGSTRMLQTRMWLVNLSTRWVKQSRRTLDAMSGTGSPASGRVEKCSRSLGNSSRSIGKCSRAVALLMQRRANASTILSNASDRLLTCSRILSEVNGSVIDASRMLSDSSRSPVGASASGAGAIRPLSNAIHLLLTTTTRRDFSIAALSPAFNAFSTASRDSERHCIVLKSGQEP